MAELLQAARSKAEELLLRERPCDGAPCAPISVVCAPDGRALRLLSPPGRAVPAALWAALAASEETPDGSARRVSESLPRSGEQQRKRARPGTADGELDCGRASQRLRPPCGVAGDVSSSGAPYELAVPEWSQGSHKSQGISEEADSRSAGCDSQATSPHFLGASFPRRIDPVIPPVILSSPPAPCAIAGCASLHAAPSSNVWRCDAGSHM